MFDVFCLFLEHTTTDVANTILEDANAVEELLHILEEAEEQLTNSNNTNANSNNNNNGFGAGGGADAARTCIVHVAKAFFNLSMNSMCSCCYCCCCCWCGVVSAALVLLLL